MEIFSVLKSFIQKNSNAYEDVNFTIQCKIFEKILNY